MPDSGSAQPREDAIYRRTYEELKRLAHSHLRATGRAITLSTTDLVHEAYLKLRVTAADDWEGDAHFFGAASRAMRNVLVDFARRRGAAKRGGDATRVSLSDAGAPAEFRFDDLLELDQALDRLGEINDRLRQLVELRFFGGFANDEVASILGLSPRTVERDWLKARLLLLRELDSSGSGTRALL